MHHPWPQTLLAFPERGRSLWVLSFYCKYCMHLPPRLPKFTHIHGSTGLQIQSSGEIAAFTEREWSLLHNEPSQMTFAAFTWYCISPECYCCERYLTSTWSWILICRKREESLLYIVNWMSRHRWHVGNKRPTKKQPCFSTACFCWLFTIFPCRWNLTLGKWMILLGGNLKSTTSHQVKVSCSHNVFWSGK